MACCLWETENPTMREKLIHSLQKKTSVNPQKRERKNRKKKCGGKKCKGPKEPIESRLTQKEAPNNVLTTLFLWNDSAFFLSFHLKTWMIFRCFTYKSSKNSFLKVLDWFTNYEHCNRSSAQWLLERRSYVFVTFEDKRWNMMDVRFHNFCFKTCSLSWEVARLAKSVRGRTGV